MEWSDFASNGRVDVHGRIANKRKTGGWKASPFIIGMCQVVERLAFFAIGVNMVNYLISVMHESLPEAATHSSNWIGASYVLTLLGAFLADAYFGRFRTILIFSAIYALGMVMLTLSASLSNLHPPQHTEASKGQSAFLYGALALIALGTGGIKPCVSSFGADQFDEGDPKEVVSKSAFFNWFYFAINTGALFGITVPVYVQEQVGWPWGFGIPTIFMLCSILILVLGVRYYRFQNPMGSPFTRFLQVMVASFRNHLRGAKLGDDHTLLYEVQTPNSDILGASKLPHTHQYRFLDKAAVVMVESEGRKRSNNRWEICTVTQVEELKTFIRVLPVWASTIALALTYSQQSTFFITQANITNRNLTTNFIIPAGSVPVFAAINAVFVVPIYEKLVVPFLRNLTGNPRGITSLQRMGVGLFMSILAMASAAMVEKKRREEYPEKMSMSVFWLFPQYFLIGNAEVFTYVGQLEFFYDEATDGTRSISSAMFLCEFGIGFWLNSVLVKIIEGATGGEERGWLRNDLNESKLDYFYWILTALNALNFLVYVFVAYSFKGKPRT
ncbi:hypothetical protein PIB30_002083 [Stylosanthes scabra]|uniref:Uncharacterized protein n=1 Tax=Stylosanthes scabra TaxID=79078 RepID=A0ABU6R3B4_9FABA|nr:hypothetical protein [Stylosanthes scabra]